MAEQILQQGWGEEIAEVCINKALSKGWAVPYLIASREPALGKQS